MVKLEAQQKTGFYPAVPEMMAARDSTKNASSHRYEAIWDFDRKTKKAIVGIRSRNGDTVYSRTLVEMENVAPDKIHYYFSIYLRVSELVNTVNANPTKLSDIGLVLADVIGFMQSFSTTTSIRAISHAEEAAVIASFPVEEALPGAGPTVPDTPNVSGTDPGAPNV